MKYSKKNRAVLSGILVGLASIGAVVSYFDVDWNELGGFMFGAVLFVVAILVMAAVTVAVVKLIGRVLKKLAARDQDSDKE